MPSAAHTTITPEGADVRAEPSGGDHRAREAVDQVLERQRLGDPLEEAGRLGGVVEHAGDEDHRQEHRVDVGGRRVEVGDHVREGDAERGEADHAGGDEHEQLDPVRRPAGAEEHPAGDRDDRDLEGRVGDRVAGDRQHVGAARHRRAVDPLEHALLAQEGHVERERGERRRHHAIPAIPGTITFRSCWLPWRIAPKKARNSSGSRKLKNAALGLRQNSRRSSRYWRQASAERVSHRPASRRPRSRGQLQVDVLERRAGDGQPSSRSPRASAAPVSSCSSVVGSSVSCSTKPPSPLR